MTPAARIQAAIEVLDLVIEAARSNGAPADRLISEWFRARRWAGSGDRRAVRELAYRAIRACGEIPATGRTAMLRVADIDPQIAALFDGSRHAPAPIDAAEPKAEAGVAPAWLMQRFADSGVEHPEALLDRAPLDIRVNTLKSGSLDLPEGGEKSVAAHGWRYPPETKIEQSPAYLEGMIEVQDAGSQLTCEVVAARPGETVIDLCAGAGGKTLALAAAMENVGRLIACDADRARLQRLPPRAERAGATGIETLLLDANREMQALEPFVGAADAVLVDAPCSGTGTWRRNPEARWRLTDKQLERYVAIQSRLLDIAATLVKPGGRLVFVTCSLLDAEGADQAEGFLTRHPDWRAELPVLPAGTPRGAGLRLSPSRDGTDGFFVARFVRL
ncbi:RsmB/NOP family class I SAM-dependent RNA methyltransferase [Novosphingobium resinovorum]|uniref:RsmB/NOP family class I SAM-dependent RNA methyltransferase n=1 Tax=Novosphingobium TaxID=165696 RepID=UPI001B3C9437|nr:MULTISPECIES: RsmB/NOP family class I SAM-dependent RNA methyltransferase [Novosphingobium]MBF7012004.1 RsmB/NOP family class I SAM-dependent RNA methyltransferase [Novosphingobium sp. HR1a]WJM26755.1 RsmB/NOP family class I SAM-dependent RNA methyltransferase [Novosphingobium resinovorum]